MTMADRIAVMDKGKVIQVAPPADVYEAPNSRFVADFIGSVNTFEGTVGKAGDGRIEIAAKDGFAIHAECLGAPVSGTTVWYAIRPEKVRVSRKAPANTSSNAAKGVVYDIAYMGDMTVYNIKLDSGKVVRTSVVNASRSAEDQMSWDDEAWVSFAPDAGIVLKG